MGTIFKVAVLTLALVGFCFLVTTYKPTMWTSGYEIPGIKVHVSWATTALLGLLGVSFMKLKWAK